MILYEKRTNPHHDFPDPYSTCTLNENTCQENQETQENTRNSIRKRL
jgi:hypothetical protein